MLCFPAISLCQFVFLSLTVSLWGRASTIIWIKGISIESLSHTQTHTHCDIRICTRMHACTHTLLHTYTHAKHELAIFPPTHRPTHLTQLSPIFFYKMVVGLVPALPPSDLLARHRPGRLNYEGKNIRWLCSDKWYPWPHSKQFPRILCAKVPHWPTKECFICLDGKRVEPPGQRSCACSISRALQDPHHNQAVGVSTVLHHCTYICQNWMRQCTIQKHLQAGLCPPHPIPHSPALRLFFSPSILALHTYHTVDIFGVNSFV